MPRTLRVLPFAAALALAVASDPAAAHPHVWVTVKSEFVFAPDGQVSAVRHHWTFDDMFSAYATQGLEAKGGVGLTREDLAPIAEVNVGSLKEFDYFTQAKADGRKAAFRDPQDYWLDQKDGLLTLHFTLPLAKPSRAKQFAMEIFDSSYFVDFTLGKDPAALTDAPAGCKLSVQDPRAAGPAQNAAAPTVPGIEGTSAGAPGVNRILLLCP